MLNVTSIKGKNQYAAAHYYSSADDYYAKDEPGEWQGNGAQALQLQGSIDQSELSRMLGGYLPNGERIQTTFNAQENMKRMGLDLTFSAPKSVSMQALVGGDEKVIKAHDAAVAHALEHVEKLAEARKKVSGKSYRERTGNMVIAKFRHELSRAKDPQLHTHAVVLNMTQRSDGKWRALSNEDIFKVQHVIDGIYKTELAQNLRNLGYSIRLTNDEGNFELAHISREQINAFSARSNVIEDILAGKGKTRETATSLEKQVIALATRPNKEKTNTAILKQYWLEKSQELGIQYEPRSPLLDKSYFKDAGLEKQKLTPAQAVVDYAIRHRTERESVVRESELVSTALRHAVGLTTFQDVKAEIKRLTAQGTLIESQPVYRLAKERNSQQLSAAGWVNYLQELKNWSPDQAKQYVNTAIEKRSLIEVEKRYTTQTALQREKVILAIERDGRHQVTPIVDTNMVKTALENSSLNPGQRAAVETIVSSPHRFVGIQGDAGTGKTYTVNRAVELAHQADYRTIALAPYGNQVKALKNEGLDAHTLASFLSTKNKSIDDKTLVILDEAGVVGSRQLQQLMQTVEQAGARMVMLGDTKQTEAIEAGKPFAQLQQQGMQTARIYEIQRQKNLDLKMAVEHAAEGRMTQSLQYIKHIEEIKSPSERHRAIVHDYMKLSPEERQGTLLVAGTNAARHEINYLVRAELNLQDQGKTFDTLSRVDMTQAQRRYAPSYLQGMVVQPEKDYPRLGLVRGEIYRVKEAQPGNKLILKRQDNTELAINPRVVTHLSVYHMEHNELSVGEMIRINRNDPGRDLTNGDRYRVTAIHKDSIQMESLEKKDNVPLRSLSLPTDKPLHLEHGYSSTVHSAQGLTNNRVLISLDTKSRTTSMNLYYVAISRARYEANIYTDSIQRLPAAIARRYNKTTALEIQKERQCSYSKKVIQPKTIVDGKEALQLKTYMSKEKQHKN